jgi:hypothetical protein
MATKKQDESIPVEAHIEATTEISTASALTPEVMEYIKSIKFETNPDRTMFAAAALKSLDWNQIGMGVDEAAKLCWTMADAMLRNRP